MLVHIFAGGIAAAERGMLPDSVTRAGIRRLLGKRLDSLTGSGVEAQYQQLRDFIEVCRQSPVAAVPQIANEQHYEVPAEFFKTVLGKRLKYSCCEWSPDCADLDEAEVQALMTTCDRAGIRDGMNILELGCGWGSLSLWMAEQYPRQFDCICVKFVFAKRVHRSTGQQ